MDMSGLPAGACPPLRAESSGGVDISKITSSIQQALLVILQSNCVYVFVDSTRGHVSSKVRNGIVILR